MTRWTDSANARLEQYFTRLRQSLADSGADAEEVIGDLRRHIAEEVAARQLTVVTEEDVGQILARIGAPESVAAVSEPTPAPVASETRPARTPAKPPGWWLLILGVLIPFGAITFEVVSGACAGLFFDPLPTAAHVVLATFVPFVNLLVWLTLRYSPAAATGAAPAPRSSLSAGAASPCPPPRWRVWLGWANGAALAISGAFTVAFLPLTPYALASIIMIVGLGFFGIGLAPLAPLFSFVCALDLRSRLRRTGGEEARLPGFWPGLVVGLGAVAFFALPMVLTNIGLHWAVSDDPVVSLRGVRLLRWADRDDELLRACYGRAGRAAEFDLYYSGQELDPEAARSLFYRVHGQPFNALRPPKLYAGHERWDVVGQEFDWDKDQGGEAVAGRLRGLSLIQSRQDAVIDPPAALAYLEWTLEFKNDSLLQREGRAQIVLPPGGVVSRLTLWVDGEEREAAFGGRSQVKGAYRDVVNQRRDPVLVSTCGPDRVLMQCFPIPSQGGTMKVRLGITAPLALTAGDEGCLRWPAFAERNFTIGGAFQHSLWADSTLPMTAIDSRLKSEPGKAGRFVLRGQLRDSELAAPASALRAHRPSDATVSWARDTRQENPPTILQTVWERPGASPDRVVLVVDGTKGMGGFHSAIFAALSRLPTNIDFALLVARDGVDEVIPLQRGTASLHARADRSQLSSDGGHDNVPALLKAWELTAPATNGAIVWIHGPQPITLESPDDLRQRFERSGNPPLLFDVETQVGPDRVLEGLDGIKAVRRVLRAGDLGDDLGRLFDTWSGRAHSFAMKRERLPDGHGSLNPPGRETSSHLVRLWAAEEVARLSEARRTDAATQIAVGHQLVTPLTGAVVLENSAQYQRAGLKPVSSDSVPSIPVVPEPSAGALMVLGAVIFTGRFMRKARG